MGSQADPVMEASHGSEAEDIAMSMIILAHVYTGKGPHRDLQAKKNSRDKGLGIVVKLVKLKIRIIE